MKTKLLSTIAVALLTLAPIVRADILPGDDDRSDRAAEKAAAKAEKENDLYDEGNDALDDHDWRRAATYFSRCASMGLSHADAATYWLAYAQSRMGSRSEALSTIVRLKQEFPKSKWVEDAKSLEVEIRQSAGQQIEPEHVEDEDVKLMAINGLMTTDPERALPILEKILAGNQTAKVKERALFVLSQSGSPRASEALLRIAKSGPGELRRKAIQFLGINGNERNRAALAEIYTAGDTSIRKAVMKAYMISGDRTHLLALAKAETNPDLRGDAAMQLGVVGARNELSELYASEPSVEVRKKIIQAMFIGGNAEKLADIARNEKVMDLKVTAIRNLGILGGGKSSSLLMSLYNSDSREEVREAVLEAFFIQGSARTLIDLARAEKNPEMKRRIIEKLSVMNSKEATDYLMEFLK